jgi:MFS family permease
MSERQNRNSKVSSDSQTAQGNLSVWAKFYSGPFYNIFMLALAWAATLTSSTLLTTIGPLSSKSLGGSDGLATFTIGVFLIGAAVSSVPSGPMFRHLGRRNGFLAGCLMQIAGGVVGAVSIYQSSVPLLLSGCFSVGLGQGIGQFYRFSATEMTPDKLKARAVTYVLTGGVLAAFLGPVSASYSRNMFEIEYAGGFCAISIIGVINAIIVILIRFPLLPSEKVVASLERQRLLSHDTESGDTTAATIGNEVAPSLMIQQQQRRPLLEIIRQPLFIISCLIPTSAHTMMVMLMSSVTLAMVASGYSFQQSSTVMVLHFLAMFSPGFFTGTLIGRYGALAVSMFGGVLFGCSTVTMWVGDALLNYYAGMILCGVGWNLSFSAGTVMLMGSYRPEEATDVQAFNDFILFSIAGGGSLASGVVYADYGWKALIYLVVVVVVLNTLLFVVSWKIKTALERERTASNLYQAINPVVLEKALAADAAKNGTAEGGIADMVDTGSKSHVEDEEDEDGVVQGVEWWQPSGVQNKSYSFAVFGRQKASSDRDQREVMMRAASVV